MSLNESVQKGEIMAVQIPKVPLLYLHARAGNGAVPTGSYTQLVPENFKRRWFSVTVPETETDECLIVLSRHYPALAGTEYGQIYLASGMTVIFSMSGDMPWQGHIYATGLTADTYVYWTEVEDFP